MAGIFDRVFLVKTETTKGTDVIPTPAANAARCITMNITPNQNNVNRTLVKQTMGDMPHSVDPDASVTVEIVCELKGSGTAGVAPDIGPLFQACRTVETIVAGTSVTYNPSSAVEKSVTIYGYKDGLLWRALGATGTCVIDETMGAVATATFTLQASYVTPTTAAVPSGASYDTSLPIVASSSTVINDGAAVNASSFSLDMGNSVQEHRVTGDHQFTVANRAPTLTFNKDSVNTAAEWNALRAGTTASLSSAINGGTGNIVTLTAPNGKRNTVAYAERAERDTLDVTYGLYESGSDDQFSIAFT